MKNKLLKSFCLTLLVPCFALAQRATDGMDFDEEELHDWERYGNFHLSKTESIEVVIGIVLLIIAFQLKGYIGAGLGCVGALLVLPLVLVLLAVAQKIVIVTLIIAAVVYIISRLF